MKTRLAVLMGLLVAVVLFTQNLFGQDLSRFAKMTLEPGQYRHQVVRAAPQELSVQERLKRASEMLKIDGPSSNLDRFRASINVSEPVELDGTREMFGLSTEVFGEGNFWTATTTADLWQWQISKRNYVTFSGVFIDPGLHPNVWGGLVWHHPF